MAHRPKFSLIPLINLLLGYKIFIEYVKMTSLSLFLFFLPCIIDLCTFSWAINTPSLVVGSEFPGLWTCIHRLMYLCNMLMYGRTMIRVRFGTHRGTVWSINKSWFTIYLYLNLFTLASTTDIIHRTAMCACMYVCMYVCYIHLYGSADECTYRR